jgi:hypothetical protein
MKLLALLLFTQAVDEVKVDQAIRRGVDFLRAAPSPAVGFAKIDDSDELILLTFIHAGVPETDAKFQSLLKKVSERELQRTYEAVLQAMIFEELDRVKHQGRIAQCAQFLADNQCANGQWSYGEPTAFAKEAPPSQDVATSAKKAGGVLDFGEAGPRAKPKVVKRVAVRKMKPGPEKGDNSNSQYAALGLRACADAGVTVPKEVLDLARKWWQTSQHPEDGKDKGAVASGEGGGIRGWCYHRTDVCAKNHRPYGSMTAGGTGALAIYDHLLGIDWRKDAAVRAGMNWLGARWTVTENPGPTELEEGAKVELYYYLYAVERLGMLCGLEKISGRDWYPEGAKAILEAQRKDGSWDDGAARSCATWDTCFAILFLKKATRALVASEDPKGKVR